MKLKAMNTCREAAEYLGYKHVESFRRAIRRCDLRLLRPTPDLTQNGRPWMFCREDLIAQKKVMPMAGRPLGGHMARAKKYKKHIQPK